MLHCTIFHKCIPARLNNGLIDDYSLPPLPFPKCSHHHPFPCSRMSRFPVRLNQNGTSKVAVTCLLNVENSRPSGPEGLKKCVFPHRTDLRTGGGGGSGLGMCARNSGRMHMWRGCHLLVRCSNSFSSSEMGEFTPRDSCQFLLYHQMSLQTD